MTVSIMERSNLEESGVINSIDCLVEVCMDPPDLYGQMHPIENPSLISQKLEEMDGFLSCIPDSRKKSLLKAMSKCPELLTNDFRLRFLRCECFRSEMAAKRLVHYWSMREKYFGEKAFAPLTVKSSLDANAWKLQVFQFVTIQGRVVAVEVAKNFSLHETTREELVKVFWYLAEIALENETTQRKGMIVLNYPVGFDIVKQKDFQMAYMLASLRGALPVRLSGYHILHPPSFVKRYLPFFYFLIGKRLQKRVIVHTEANPLETLEYLYGLPSNELPDVIGGSQPMRTLEFFEERSKLGL